jgi:hypothetical protein
MSSSDPARAGACDLGGLALSLRVDNNLGISLRGAGAPATIIKSSAALSSAGSIIVPGTDTSISGVYVMGSNSAGAALGTPVASANFQRVRCHDLILESPGDVLFLHPSAATCSIAFHNCRLNGNQRLLRVDAACNLIELWSCLGVVAGGTSITATRAIGIDAACTVNVHGGLISAKDGTSTNYAVDIPSGSFTAAVNLFFAALEATGTGAVDLRNNVSSSAINVIGALRRNGELLTTSGSGPINYDLNLRSLTAFSGSDGKVKADGTNSQLLLANAARLGWGTTSTVVGSVTVDAGLTRTATNTVTLDNGSTGKGHLNLGNLDCSSIRPKSVFRNGGSYTVGSSDTAVYMDATTGDADVTLPTSGRTDQIIIVKKVDSNSSSTVSVLAGSNTIDGNSTYGLTTPNQFVVVQWDTNGGDWRVIGAG